jgi:hypothetical protein
MIKSILKEVIITVLLCAVIILILGVVFYEYNPVNKVVPSKIDQYATSDQIKEEINVNVLSLETTSVVYKVEATDLNVYIKNKSYVQGKANPFDSTPAGSGTAEQVDGTASSSNSGTGTGTTTSSDGTFWNSTKTK